MPVAVTSLAISATNIRKIREAHGLSQEELGHLAGISGRQVWKIETMDRGHVPKLTTALAIARVLGKAVEDLFVLKAKTRKR